MYKLDCHDLGAGKLDETVNHVTTGATVDEVIKKAMDHAKAHHADMLKAYSTPEQQAQMVAQMKSLIKTVA
jgi:predicted small metal-binding protein